MSKQSHTTTYTHTPKQPPRTVSGVAVIFAFTIITISLVVAPLITLAFSLGAVTAITTTFITK